MISDGILNLATVTGTSTKELTDGMFDIESAGFHGAAGLQVLEAASKGAKVGGADLATTTNALTTIMTDYHLKGGQAASATNAMMSAAASGKMTLQDLAGSMGTVLPIASSLGISFPQVGAAISVMTNSGMSADESTQHLANTIRSLAAPNAVAEKSMLSIGLTAQQVKDTLSTQGLTGTIELIEDHVGKKFPAGSVASVQAFRDIMGGATGYSTALMLGGKNMESFKTNVDAISKSLNTGGSSIEGWSTVQQNFNFKMSQAKEVIETTGIKIGTALMPAVTQLSNAFTFLVGVGTNVANFFNHNQV
ncbi:MAG: phage tail tape measure protein, partial [Acidobacteria bacterium 13_1_20CM_3_53_8]